MSNDDDADGYKVCKEGCHVSVGVVKPLKEGFRPTGGYRDNLPKCAEDTPPMPDGVTFTRMTTLDLVLSYVGDAAFFLFCIIVIVGFFMFVAFGLHYWLSRFMVVVTP